VSEQIHTITKNSRETLVFSLSEFKGKSYLDVRFFVRGEDGSQDFPSKKGVTLPVDLYPQFRGALAQVEKALVTRGLLDREDLEIE
jgi:hypothetical protein